MTDPYVPRPIDLHMADFIAIVRADIAGDVEAKRALLEGADLVALVDGGLVLLVGSMRVNLAITAGLERAEDVPTEDVDRQLAEAQALWLRIQAGDEL